MSSVILQPATLNPVTWVNYCGWLYHQDSHTNFSTSLASPWAFLAKPESPKMAATPSIHMSCTYGPQFSVTLCCLVFKTFIYRIILRLLYSQDPDK